MKKPTRVKNILKFIDNSLKFENKKTINLEETEFIILETFPHIDLGWILTGFLSKGRLNVGKKLLWYCKESKEVTVKSIHKNNNPVNKISNQQIVTICLDKLINLKSKPKYGFLSNKKILSNKILVIEWIYLKNNDYDKINGFIDNNFINLRKIGKKKNSIIYFIENTFSNFYIKNKIFLFSDGFGRLI